jgi:hypothetical protein
MLTNKPYEEVLEALHPDRKPGDQYATTPGQIVDGLEVLGFVPKMDNETPIKLYKIRKNAIIIIEYPNEQRHAVCWCAKKKAIYDPDIGIITNIKEYKTLARMCVTIKRKAPDDL